MRINIKLVLFMLFTYIFLFQNFIQNYIPIFQYLDELIAIFGLIVIIIKKVSKNKLKNNDKILLNLVLLLVLGFTPNFIFKYQPLNIALIDALIIAKFFLVYLLSGELFDYKFIQDNKKIIRKNISTISIFFLVLSIFNFVFGIWNSDVRFGITSNRLFYSHPSFLASVSIFLLSLNNLLKENDEKRLKIIEIILYLLILSTLRYKAIAATFIVYIMSLIIIKSKKTIKFKKLLILGVFGLIIGWSQINYYYFELDQSARSQLTVKSIEIVKDHFPLGTGFGTYASYASGVNYSPIYIKYNLYNIQGLTKIDHSFVSDTFWPMILGQFGIFGTIIYIYMLLLIYGKIKNDFSVENIYLYISKIMLFIYLIILSTSDSSFVHPASMCFAMILGISITKRDDLVNEEN